MRIALLGHGQWACMVLRALVEKGHEIAVVVTETDAFEERRREDNDRFDRFGAYESLLKTAQSMDLKVLQPNRFHAEDVQEFLAGLNPELFICVSYHTILKPSFLSRYPDRVVNAHLAPLPRYRGRAPLNWAILNGEDHTAVTVHLVDEGIDTGPILVQERVPILDEDHAIDVLLRALPLFPEAVLKAVGLLERGETSPASQDPSEGTYFPRRTAADGLVHWNRDSALTIHRKIRALSDPYPGAFAYWGDRKVVFLASKLLVGSEPVSPEGGLVFKHGNNGEIFVSTVDGSLVISRVRIGDDEGEAASMIRLGAWFRSSPVAKQGAS